MSCSNTENIFEYMPDIRKHLDHISIVKCEACISYVHVLSKVNSACMLIKSSFLKDFSKLCPLLLFYSMQLMKGYVWRNSVARFVSVKVTRNHSATLFFIFHTHILWGLVSGFI